MSSGIINLAFGGAEPDDDDDDDDDDDAVVAPAFSFVSFVSFVSLEVGDARVNDDDAAAAVSWNQRVQTYVSVEPRKTPVHKDHKATWRDEEAEEEEEEGVAMETVVMVVDQELKLPSQIKICEVSTWYDS